MRGVPLRSVAHCNVNCSDLATSRRFYEGVLGLTASTHTAPDPQDGSGFGLAGPVSWDAWMLHDHRGPFAAPVIDLLQWITPPPTGRPQASPADPGLVRLVFWAPDLAALRARAEATHPDSIQHESEGALALHDPDGVQLLIWERPVEALEFRGVTINCTDLTRSVPWYERVLGVTVVGTSSVTPSGPRFTEPDSRPRVRLATLALPQQGHVFELQLESWPQTRTGSPTYGSANHLGIFRMAFMADDLDGWYTRLAAAGVRCFSPPVTLDMGPEVPIDGLRALFFADPDGACLELIEPPTTR